MHGKENMKSLCSSEYERRKNEEIWTNFLNLSEENVIIQTYLGSIQSQIHKAVAENDG